MKTILKIAAFMCNQCGHKWVPKTETKVPRMCPKCKSVCWNDPPKKKRGLK